MLSDSRFTEARRVALWGMAVSGGLCVLKIGVGLAGGSVASVADGLESGGDVLASAVVLTSLMVAARPADFEHPYGHGRAEAAAGQAVGVLLVIGGVLIAGNALAGLDRPRHPPAVYTLWPLLLSAAAKAGLAIVKFRVGRRLGSIGLTADAWNDGVDVLSSSVAAVAVAVAVWWPGSLAGADNIGAAVVGTIVTAVGLGIVRETLTELMDTRPAADFMDRIAAVAAGVEGVRRVETCRARKSGLYFHVDLHVEVDPAITVLDGHRIAHRVKDAVRAAAPEIADVLVHVEPHADHSEEPP